MSTWHSIDIILGAKFCEKDIKAILEKLLLLDCIYYDYVWGEKYEDSPLLNVSEATNKILQTHNTPRTEDEHPSVFLKINGTFAFLTFLPTDRGLLLSFEPSSNIKKKNFPDYPNYIDLSYYIQLLLKICRDYALLELKTEKN